MIKNEQASLSVVKIALTAVIVISTSTITVLANSGGAKKAISSNMIEQTEIKTEENEGIEIIDKEDLILSYNEITEKIVEVEEEIAFQTIKQGNPGASGTYKVVQEGVNGVKKVFYKVKYT